MREGGRPGWQNRTEAEIRTFYWSHKMTKIINVEHKSPQRTQLYILPSTYTEGPRKNPPYIIIIGLHSKEYFFILVKDFLEM